MILAPSMAKSCGAKHHFVISIVKDQRNASVIDFFPGLLILTSVGKGPFKALFFLFDSQYGTHFEEPGVSFLLLHEQRALFLSIVLGPAAISKHG